MLLCPLPLPLRGQRAPSLTGALLSVLGRSPDQAWPVAVGVWHRCPYLYGIFLYPTLTAAFCYQERTHLTELRRQDSDGKDDNHRRETATDDGDDRPKELGS